MDPASPHPTKLLNNLILRAQKIPPNKKTKFVTIKFPFNSKKKNPELFLKIQTFPIKKNAKNKAMVLQLRPKERKQASC
jgi:hypothetical protein